MIKYFSKMQMLVSIAKMYYLEDKTQNEIAKILGVSRPLISKYLMEARQLGLVKIQINDILNECDNDEILASIKIKFNIKSGFIIPTSTNRELNDKLLIDHTIEYLAGHYTDNSLSGIGWGSMICGLAERLSTYYSDKLLIGELIPLISNAPVSFKTFHTNEILRIMNEATGIKTDYLYAPFICSSLSEKEMFTSTENVQNIMHKWDHMDNALIQIRNFPSTPDLATQSRFGKLLISQKCVGMFLGYYFDINGNFITSENDFTIQVPISTLRNTKNVIAIVNERVNPQAVIGALRTKLFTCIIIDNNVALKVLDGTE